MPLKYINKHLNSLHANYVKFAVLGTHDYFGDSREQIIFILEHAGFTILMDDGIFLNSIGRDFYIVGGLDDSLMGTPDMTAMFKKQSTKRSFYLIILTHEPDIADEIKLYEPNLILAGYSHGGQIKLPFLTVKIGWLRSIQKVCTN